MNEDDERVRQRREATGVINDRRSKQRTGDKPVTDLTIESLYDSPAPIEVVLEGDFVIMDDLDVYVEEIIRKSLKQRRFWRR